MSHRRLAEFTTAVPDRIRVGFGDHPHTACRVLGEELAGITPRLKKAVTA